MASDTPTNVKIGDLFTEDDIRRAVACLRTDDRGFIRTGIVTEEKMRVINAATGQENDRDYMAYLLEYVAGVVR